MKVFLTKTQTRDNKTLKPAIGLNSLRKNV
uniref:Uncharacterized protein n=1 Tax=Solanum lycopersicum TaxID=4081 RepID=K4CTI6_SOLLC